MKTKLPAGNSSSTKDGNIDDDGKKLNGHIRFKDYLTCEKI